MKDDARDDTLDRALPERRGELLSCDLVMKGGITSGVVYPKAVVRVAREYQVRSVGGTSVGAIAASLVAAAEYERQRHDDPLAAWDGRLDEAIEADLAGTPIDRREEPQLGRTGYGALYGIPAEIGNNLLAKFQPTSTTRSLFEYIFTWMQKFETPVGRAISAALLGLWWPRILAVLAGLLVFGGVRLLDPTGDGRASLILGTVITILVIVVIRFSGAQVRMPLRAVVGVAILSSLLLARVFWSIFSDDTTFMDMGESLSLADAWDELIDNWDSVLVDLVPWVAVFWVIGAVLYLVWAVLRILPRNHFGMCTGLGDSDAITNWMHDSLNRISGLEATGGGAEGKGTPVLTFGHLAPARNGGAGPQGGEVRLEMIGTDIRRGVPLRLPDALTPRRMDDGQYRDGYLFDPVAFANFFPQEVVAALKQGGRKDAQERYPFPPKEDIPVVVTTRMSMSFPILFRAVPVIYCDSNGEQWNTWISDGGIVSNFPSNLFDQSLPPWPTFGLDLIDVDDETGGTSPELPYIYRYLTPESPYRFSSSKMNLERLPTQEMRTVGAFLMGAVNAARGWIDNSQKRLPGYAERIVGMKIYPGEGGLNLTMDRPKIETLARRGLLGVDTLLRLWDPETQGNQWRYHRWVRMRTLMREIEEVGRQWNTWYAGDPGSIPEWATSFQNMTEAMPAQAGDSPAAFPYPIVKKEDRAHAQALVGTFSAFAQQAAQAPAGAGAVRDTGAALGERASVVFDAPDSPSPNPDLLLMPPFE